MLNTLSSIIYMMSAKEKLSFAKLSFLIVIMSVLDTVGIASILPFFSLASDPSNIYKNRFLNFLYIQFKFNTEINFLIFIGIICIFTFIVSTLARVYTQINIYKFSYFLEFGLVNRLLNKSISRDYEYFISRHSADFSEKILSRVEQLISGFILPMIFIFANILLLSIILIFLLVLDFRVTLSLIIFLSSFYFFINITLSEYIKSLGKKRLETQRKKFKILSELIGGIKEVKLFDSEDIFLNSFSKVSYEYASSQSTAKSLSLVPKFGIELICLIAVITIILFKLILTNNDFISIISYLSVYTLAAYKLLPSIQQIFNQNLLLKYNKPLLDTLFLDYKDLVKNNYKDKYPLDIKINKNIRLKNVSYNYPESSIDSLKNININFDVSKCTAIVGPSGSGKSTLVEVLCGILKIKKGEISIDENLVSHINQNSWNKNFAVVPQTVYILDDSVIANITFGLDPKSVSLKRVKYAAKIACLDKLIENNMPNKYLTILGERGVKLSGGQRQRIAIARAIYRKANFIIFDEATSELDSETERKIISNIKTYKNAGIISIAHRISTIKDFDEILLMKNGLLKAKGSYHELMEYEDFRVLSNLEQNKNNI